jgi:hypothetical protein
MAKSLPERRRFGSESGIFVTVPGTPPSMLSLPPGVPTDTMNLYKVISAFNAMMGTAAPWFGQFGWGLQTLLPAPVDQMIGGRLFREGAVMNRKEMKALFDKENISPRTYSIYGLTSPPQDEQYVLDKVQDTWITYYSEKGLRISLQYFYTEDEACNYMSRKILEDPTTRMKK